MHCDALPVFFCASKQSIHHTHSADDPTCRLRRQYTHSICPHKTGGTSIPTQRLSCSCHISCDTAVRIRSKNMCHNMSENPLYAISEWFAWDAFIAALMQLTRTPQASHSTGHVMTSETGVLMKNSVGIVTSRWNRQTLIPTANTTNSAHSREFFRLSVFTDYGMIQTIPPILLKAPCALFLFRNKRVAVQALHPYRAQLSRPVYLYGVLVHAYRFFLCPAWMTQQVLHIHIIVQDRIVAFVPASFESGTEFMQCLLKLTYWHHYTWMVSIKGLKLTVSGRQWCRLNPDRLNL